MLVVAAAAVVLAGCGAETAGSAGPPPDGGRLRADVLAMNPGGWASRSIAAISDSPIHMGAFTSWFGSYDAHDLLADSEDVVDEPGTVYLAVTGQTGCRTPETVEVWRSGADLDVRFVGGTDHEECVRAVGPVAYLAVPAPEVDGVRTVGGAKPVEPGGPGELTEFVELGTAPVDVAEVDLADAGATAALKRRLVAAGLNPGTALDEPVPAGRRGFAFVKAGCAETSAVLVLDQHVTAQLTGGENTACDAPVFFLVTFLVDAEYVP